MATFRSILTALLTAAMLQPAHTLMAQNSAPSTGRIAGRVLEEGTGAPVPGAQVGIAAGGVPVSAGIDGRFLILSVPAGPVAIAVRAIGYSPKTVSGIVVPAGGVATQDIVLAATSVQLGEITVSAAAERGSVAAALQEQRDAAGIVNGVTAEQIQRSPDSDAGQAIQRVSGVSVQDGRYVFVRGLGERYTTTALNGARVPSPEPDRRVVPLNLFPAGLLEAVQTSKTFTPDQPGDFSGAEINIRTREFYSGRMLGFSVATGANTAVAFRDVASAPRTGSEWFAVPGPTRALPASVDAAGDLTGTSQSEIPGLIGSFRNVWSAQQSTGMPNASLQVSAGGEDPILGRVIGYVGSLTWGYDTEVHRGEVRALAVADTGSTTRPYNAYRGESVTGSVLWGGILNLTTRIGSGTKLSFNNTFNRSGDNTAVRAAGDNEEFGRVFDITRLTYTARSVRSSQLTGEHLIAGSQTINWGVTSSAVTRQEPDRSDVVYDALRDTITGVVTPREWWGGSRSGNRTFGNLGESAWQGDAGWRWALNSRTAVKIGGQYRTTDRDDDTRSYDILNVSLSNTQLAAPPEQVFTNTSQLTLFANANGGRYTARDRLAAGFVQVEVQLGRSLRLVTGARVEHSQVTVDTRSTQGQTTRADNVFTDVLPAVALTWEVARDQQLRFGLSQTLSRPEYRELSSVCYYEILGGSTVCGNPGLRRALIQNADVRWEWYPSGGELVSVGVFAKRFHDPIERILVGTTNSVVAGFVNAEHASNYGVEFEARKNLGTFASALLPFTVFANATLMRSTITPGASAVSALTSSSRPMVGQSPYMVNAGLAYTSPGGATSLTALYNVVGRRIVEAGVQPLPDTYEEARNMFDVALRQQLSTRLAFKVDAKNLLDSPYRVTQGQVTRHSYTAGRIFTIGLAWGR